MSKMNQVVLYLSLLFQPPYPFLANEAYRSEVNRRLDRIEKKMDALDERLRQIRLNRYFKEKSKSIK